MGDMPAAIEMYRVAIMTCPMILWTIWNAMPLQVDVQPGFTHDASSRKAESGDNLYPSVNNGSMVDEMVPIDEADYP